MYQRLFFVCVVVLSAGCASKSSLDLPVDVPLRNHARHENAMGLDEEILLEHPTSESWVLQEQVIATNICAEEESYCSFRLAAVRGVDERSAPSVRLWVHYVLERLPKRWEVCGVAWLPQNYSRYFYRNSNAWHELEPTTDAFNRENRFVAWLWNHIKAENEKR